jgi:hypothetical protein
MKYELTFWGAGTARYFPRYRRNHAKACTVRETIERVREALEGKGLSLAAHTPVIYRNGAMIAPSQLEDMDQ